MKNPYEQYKDESFYEKTIDLDLERENIFCISEFHEAGWNFLTKEVSGYNCPWTTLKNDFKLVKGELTVLSGYTSQGKSEASTHIGLHAISQGAKVMIASLEMTAAQIHARLAQQAIGTREFSNDEKLYRSFSNYYAKKLFIYNKCGSVLASDILVAAERLNIFRGVDFFIIDNLMMLDNKVDDFNKQLDSIQRLSEFAKTLDVCVLLIAHSKKPQNKNNNQNSNDILIPGISDIFGSSTIGNLIDNHMSLTINRVKMRALEMQKNHQKLGATELNALDGADAFLARDKKREFGNNFMRELFYDKEFRRLKDYKNQTLQPYFKPFDF